MNKLLSAEFVRLWKDKVFWLSAAFLCGWGVVLAISGHQAALTAPTGEAKGLEGYFFQYGPVIGGVCAVVTSMFLGTDHSDGAIRNKIIAGHSRQAVYGAGLLVCTAAGFLLNLAWCVGMLGAGLPLLGGFRTGIASILAYLVISLFMIAAFSAIFTLIGMLNSNKAGAAVTALVVFLALLFLASYCYNRLSEPEMYRAAVMAQSNGVELTDPMPNPDYVSGALRKVYEFVVDFLPTGQGILLADTEAAHGPVLPLYSAVIVAAATLAGNFFFRRKDLN